MDSCVTRLVLKRNAAVQPDFATASLFAQCGGRHAEAGRIVGFASTSPYRPRECYAKIAEFSVYVARGYRGRGVGRLALEALIQEAAAAGLHKLVSRIFPENVASRAACRSVGFREVGIYKAHGELEGVWKDCVIVERVVGS